MTKKKCDTTGMKDMFHEAQREIEREMNALIAEKEQEIQNIKPNVSEYDNGQGAVEDRNEETAIRMELMQIKQERDKKISELETYQK